MNAAVVFAMGLVAATPQNGGRDVIAKRGDCVHQLRVNDLATEPKR